MPINESVRIFKIGDTEVIQKADSLALAMKRDIRDFASRNVDDARIDEMLAQNEDFKKLPTDQELLGTVITATETRDVNIFELRKKLAAVRNMAETKYGNNGKFRTFAFGELSSLNGEDLFRTAKRVARVGTLFLADLATEGLTAGLLTEISTLSESLDRNIDEVEAAIEIRDIATQERINMANKLWSTMVKYADIGKSLYEFTDEARYNDYVLNPAGTTAENPAPPTP